MEYMQPSYQGIVDPMAFWNLNALSSVCNRQPIDYHHPQTFTQNGYQSSLEGNPLHQSMTSESDSSDVTAEVNLSLTRSDSDDCGSDKSMADKSLDRSTGYGQGCLGSSPDISSIGKEVNLVKSSGKSTSTQQQRQFGNEKPPYSYMAMIVMAIESSPSGMMSLSDIYAYIIKRFPFYHKHQKRWQNSIRHNLSLNDCFVKVPRVKGHSLEKGSLWKMHQNSGNMFKDGSFLRRSKKFKVKKADRSPPKQQEMSNNFYQNQAYESAMYSASALGNLSAISSHPYAYSPYRTAAPSLQKSSALPMTSYTSPASSVQPSNERAAFQWTPYPDMYYNAHAYLATQGHYSAPTHLPAFHQPNSFSSDYFSQKKDYPHQNGYSSMGSLPSCQNSTPSSSVPFSSPATCLLAPQTNPTSGTVVMGQYS